MGTLPAATEAAVVVALADELEAVVAELDPAEDELEVEVDVAPDELDEPDEPVDPDEHAASAVDASMAAITRASSLFMKSPFCGVFYIANHHPHIR